MHLLFLPGSPLVRHSRLAPVQACKTRMASERQGFGSPSKKPSRPASPGEQRRKAASDRYDRMAAAGMPEYTIWMRLKEVPDAPQGDDDEAEKMPWLPVGCLSVPRSSQVSQAIFDAEQDLMQGAIRLFPNVRNQPRDNIEFGFQLREFDDEEIRVAERESGMGIQGTLRRWFRAWQDPMNTALKDRS